MQDGLISYPFVKVRFSKNNRKRVNYGKILFYIFNRYCPDSNLRKSHEFTEEKLRKLIQDILLKMKNLSQIQNDKHGFP